MLGLTSNLFQAQTIVPLSYSFSQLPGILNGAKSNALKGIPSSSVGYQQVFNSSYPAATYDKIKRDLGIDEKNLLAVTNSLVSPLSCSNTRQLKSILKPRLLYKSFPWHQSYVSYSTFSENKNGYPADYHDQLLKRVLSNHTVVHSLLYGNSRHFKTKRSSRFESQEPQMLLQIMKQGSVTKDKSHDLEKESSQKPTQPLMSILDEESETSKKNLKIAFFEGFAAASREAPKQQTTITQRLIYLGKAISAILTLLLLIPILLLLNKSGVFKITTGLENEVVPEEISVTFDDVRGVEEAKDELEEIVEFLRNPEKFTTLGAELPKGALLVGPPGTGKTLLARAVAGEASVPFFQCSGSQFDEVLVGQGAKRVRELFTAAKEKAPCVIFIDEIDSVGGKRSVSTLHPYANQTINQLLSEMDGFHKNEGVIVLGATNRLEDLDKALLRPGRFDVEVHVRIPDLAGRRDIFDYYLKKIKAHREVDVSYLARGTTGMTGADIKNVVNQAALRAAVEQANQVTMKHLLEARDKVIMGPEKKSRIPDDEVNLMTAYHEGGHTIVSYYTKNSDPLHKVTIVPRGQTLGHTSMIPDKDQYHLTKKKIIAQIDVLMGGRAAEELSFGSESITSGAGDDLMKATRLATLMVQSFGMSEKVGFRTFLGDKFVERLSYNTKESIDSEIKRILNESNERAKSILRVHSKELKSLAEALVKYETLDADEIQTILEGKAIHKDL